MDQAGAGVQDIRRHQVGDGAVQPVPAGELDADEADHDPDGGEDVGEDVLAVGHQDDGAGAFAHHHQGQAQDEIDHRRTQHQEDTAGQPGNSLGVEEPGPGLIEDSQGRQDDEGPFEAGGEILHLAVAVRVIRVGAAGREDDAPQGEGRGHHVDDGLQGVGEDGGGVGQKEGEKLHRHQPGADGQGDGDGDEVRLDAGGGWGVHSSPIRNRTNVHGYEYNFLSWEYQAEYPKTAIVGKFINRTAI